MAVGFCLEEKVIPKSKCIMCTQAIIQPESVKFLEQLGDR